MTKTYNVMWNSTYAMQHSPDFVLWHDLCRSFLGFQWRFSNLWLFEAWRSRTLFLSWLPHFAYAIPWCDALEAYSAKRSANLRFSTARNWALLKLVRHTPTRIWQSVSNVELTFSFNSSICRAMWLWAWLHGPYRQAETFSYSLSFRDWHYPSAITQMHTERGWVIRNEFIYMLTVEPSDLSKSVQGAFLRAKRDCKKARPLSRLSERGLASI